MKGEMGQREEKTLAHSRAVKSLQEQSDGFDRAQAPMRTQHYGCFRVL